MLGESCDLLDQCLTQSFLPPSCFRYTPENVSLAWRILDRHVHDVACSSGRREVWSRRESGSSIGMTNLMLAPGAARRCVDKTSSEKGWGSATEAVCSGRNWVLLQGQKRESAFSGVLLREWTCTDKDFNLEEHRMKSCATKGKTLKCAP